MIKQEQIAKAKAEKKFIKCVVWDLDNTVWDGVLLEDSDVTLRPGVVEALEVLDSRGILLSVASKNEHNIAMDKLKEFGIDHYFLYPEINWNAKSLSLQQISKSLNIGLDTFAFIDDQPFEREEVTHVSPEVLVIDAADLDEVVDMPQLMPRFLTPESRLRRQMYQSDISRNSAETDHQGASDEFLSQLDMVFEIRPAAEEDLQRAEELTARTNQLNTTGYTYSYDELNELRQRDDVMLLVSSLTDKYGTYGTIGLTLVEKGDAHWTVKLLLMSCRVMSRGVGTIMMAYIMQQAKAAGATLRAEFIPNGRNRMMYVTYKFGGFTEIDKQGDLIVFENDLTEIQEFPTFVDINIIEKGDPQPAAA